MDNDDARLIACLDNLVDVQLGPGRMSLALDDGALAAWQSQLSQGTPRIQVRVDGQAWPEIFAPEPSYSLGVMMPTDLDVTARLAIEERLRGWISESLR